MAVLRDLTPEERKEITPLNAQTILKSFQQKLADKITEHRKLYRPFDQYGAQIDFDKYLQTKITDMTSVVDPEKVDNKFDFSLEPYGDVSRFEYKGKSEYKVPRRVLGIQEEVIPGMSYKFVTKVRGNGFSIFVPNETVEEYEKWLQ